MKAYVKAFFFTLLFSAMTGPMLHSKDYHRSVLANPSLSRRCEYLTKEREEKLQHKQKIMELITRNQVLVKKTPPHRKSVLNKLKHNFNRLRHELRLTLLQITRQEETIVRKGCPGITL